MSGKKKIMSFNLRIPTPQEDGINDFYNRKEKIAATIASESPDLIGFQEATDGSRAWLRDTLTDYMVVGCGRLKNYRGESAPLAFRKDKFEMVSMETFWLSCTPQIAESRYEGTDQSPCPRLATAVVLKPIDSDGLLLFVNVHTDHEGSVARVLASAQLLEYISGKGLPCILTGDFNAEPDTDEIKMLSSNSKCKLTDTTAKLGGTFHGFGRYSDENAIKIDYIFTNLPSDINESYAIEDKHENGIYISDHRPVVAFVEI